MAVSETLRARQAALLLHGLPADTRGRVLARLSPGETARLQPLLSELAEIGASPSLSRELHEVTSAGSPVPIPPGTSARDRAHSLSASQVAAALTACAPVTMAAVLRIAEWPWRQEVLARTSELRRAEVQRRMRGEMPTLSPAVAEALCERLCREVTQ